MSERGGSVLNQLERTLAERNGEYESSDDLLSSSHQETSPTASPAQISSRVYDNVQFPHMRKHTLTGTFSAHTQIYIVNEQIIHGKSTWSTSLCAFDSLHSANTEARTHAIIQHAKGAASKVQVYFRNGYGTWTTNLDTERGRITKSVFVNATVLQHLVTPLAGKCEEQGIPGDRMIPSRVPGSLRVRRIQAFRSTDSIRIDCERARLDVDTRPFPPPKLALHESTSRKNLKVPDFRIWNDEGKEKGKGVEARTEDHGFVRKQTSIDDLREFSSLHTLF